jgi:hypothetical protein
MEKATVHEPPTASLVPSSIAPSSASTTEQM